MSAIREEDVLYARLSSFRREVDRALQRIERAYREDTAWAVSYSGGKDSTVTLDLVRQIMPDCPAVFIDSGAEFPETLDTVQATPNVIMSKAVIPLLDMYRMVGDWGSTSGDPNTHWGAHDVIDSMIREPMKQAHAAHNIHGAFTGVRGEESKGRDRFGATHRQPWKMVDGTWRCEPVIDWPQQMVWAYIAYRGLTYNAVYDRYAELGLPREEWRVAPYAGATSISRGRWAVLKRGWPDLWNRFAAEFPRVRGYQ